MDVAVRDGFVETLQEEQQRLHEVLQHYGFYQSSSPSQRMELLAAARPVAAEDRQSLLEANYSCRDVVFVGTGRLRVYVTGESGREVTLYYVHQGESCPVNLSAAVMGIGAFANASACGDLGGVAIPADRFRQIAEINTDVREYIFAATVLRLGEREFRHFKGVVAVSISLISLLGSGLIWLLVNSFFNRSGRWPMRCKAFP